MACVTGPAPKIAGMAVLAGIGSAMVHGEVVRTVISGGQPGAGGMAVLAGGAKLTRMYGWFLVTGNTGAGSTFKAVCMT